MSCWITFIVACSNDAKRSASKTLAQELAICRVKGFESSTLRSSRHDPSLRRANEAESVSIRPGGGEQTHLHGTWPSAFWRQMRRRFRGQPQQPEVVVNMAIRIGYRTHSLNTHIRCTNLASLLQTVPEAFLKISNTIVCELVEFLDA